MGSKMPHRFEAAEQRFPVRLTVYASPNPNDWANEVTSRWLRQRVGESGYCTMPAQSMSGEKADRILLPSVYDAAALLLAWPAPAAAQVRPPGPSTLDGRPRP